MRILSFSPSKSNQSNINAWLKPIALCLFAVALAGCASKRNAKIDGQAAAGKTEATAKAAQASANPTGNSTSAKSGTPSGVQVTAAPTGINKFVSFLKPYRIDIQQGNFISQEMVAQLKPGQTREQVRFILGTPLVADVFHANRWDYTFRLQKHRGETTIGHLSVFFNDDKLERFTNVDLPTEQDYIARIAGPALKDTRVQPEPIAAPAK
jgi:outer membrane protein assembly factor BamE